MAPFVLVCAEQACTGQVAPSFRPKTGIKGQEDAGFDASYSYKGWLNVFFTELETDRLFLRNICSCDREFIYSEFTDDFINKYLFDAEPMKSINEADELIEFYTVQEPSNRHRWVIELKQNGEKIGTCGYHCWNIKEGKVEIGYELVEKYNGYGYMNEAIIKVVEFARINMRVKEIKACIYYKNEKSKRIVTGNGFEYGGIEMVKRKGIEYKHEIYRLMI